MRWLVDECVDSALVSLLRQTGHDVLYMADDAPRTSDAAVIQKAAAEGRLLLTDDKDFGDLVFRQGLQVPGLVLLRIDPANYEQRRVRLLSAIERFGQKLLGHYTVVQVGRLRVRKL